MLNGNAVDSAEENIGPYDTAVPRLELGDVVSDQSLDFEDVLILNSRRRRIGRRNAIVDLTMEPRTEAFDVEEEQPLGVLGVVSMESGESEDHDLLDQSIPVGNRIGRRNALAHIMDDDNTGDDDDDDEEGEDRDDQEEDRGDPDDDDTTDEENDEEDLLSVANGSRRTSQINQALRQPDEENDEQDLLSVANESRRTSQISQAPQQPGQINSANEIQSPTITSTPPDASTSSKRKQSSPKNPTPKKTRDSLGSQDDDADCCPICFEPWSNSGKHKLSSLKCGHVFGQKCIERWIKSAKKCPQCNAKARKGDIRVLYAKRLKAVDMTELTEAVSLYETEKGLRRKKEMELAKVQMQYQMAVTEVNKLKSQIEDLKNNQVVLSLPESVRESVSAASSSSTHGKTFSHLKNVLLSSVGKCRVMDYHAESLSLAISQPSPHANFMSGFGLKKFSLADMKSSQFNILHTKAIKDVRFSPHNGLVLTASQDETLRITSWESNSHVHSYKPQRPVWCCCWDALDSNLLYGGLSNGCINCYDMRYTADVLHTITNPVSRCPIVAMYNIPRQTNPDIPGGILAQTLEGVTFWKHKAEASNSEYEPHYLPLQPGNCAGIQYSRDLKQCLVTYRPGRSYQCTTHLLCQLEFSTSSSLGISANVIETYRGGQTHKMLTRNAIFSTQSTGNLICVGDEAKNTVNIYEARSRGRLLQALSCSGPVLDILPISINETNFLATLTDKELKIYEQK